MRAPLKATVLLAVLVLASFSVASGQAVWVNVDEISGLNPDYTIPAGGTTLEIPIHISNAGVNRTAISNGFDFHGDVAYTGIDAMWSLDYPWDYPAAIRLLQFPPYFDQGIFTNYFNTPLDPDPDIDGVGFAGLTGAAGSGLPSTFNGVAWIITINGVSGDPGQTLVMDSSWWLPANYWLWSGVAGNVSWAGPYVFEVEGPQCDAPVITTTPVTTGYVGDAYTYDVNATGTPPITIELTVKPEFLAIDGEGVITGVLGAVGVYDVTVVASNDCGTATQSYQITVSEPLAPPVITSVPVTTGEELALYSYQVTATGNPEPTFDLMVAPAGMVINGGLITWTPADGVAGDHDVTVRASNSEGHVDQVFVITVTPNPELPVIVAIPDADLFLGDEFTYDVNISAGYPIPTFELVTAPAGMTINENSGVIQWTADPVGDHTVTVAATNSVGTATETFVLSVTDCVPNVLLLWSEQMIYLKSLPEGRTMPFGIFCDDFGNIDQASIRVFNIPPYAGTYMDEYEGKTCLVTTAFVMRFLGAGGFRPIPSEGYLNEEYPVTYNYTTGGSNTLTGLFSLSMSVGDVTFDGVTNIDDVIFMTQYFFEGGPEARLYNERMDECMDVDASGRIDLLDAQAILQTAGL